MTKFTVNMDGQKIGTLRGPHEEMIYPWVFVWDAPWGEHPLLIYTEEDPCVQAVIVAVCVGMARSQAEGN